MKSITKGMKEELCRIRNLGQLPVFVAAFNNEEEYRRAKNCCRPRTDLMTRGLRHSTNEKPINDYAEKCFIPHAMIEAQPELSSGIEWLFSRYVDIGCQGCDTWFQGKAFWEWIVEVENDWKELKGTLADLLRTQAKRKLGIFYHPELENRNVKKELKKAVENVFDAFTGECFAESGNTFYEIIVLPEELSSENPGSFRCLNLSFCSAKAPNSVDSPTIAKLLF